MNRTIRGMMVAGLAVGMAWHSVSAAQEEEQAGGFSPEEAVRRMVVPGGFRVGVFASEPEVRQPVAACFDERGRMWVIEYLQYPNPAGLKAVEVDVYLRTKYDKVPDPPPHGPRGADRIKILEDTDGDGKADKVKVFVEGLNLASAIAVGHGGVFVGQAPYLLFYPDRDGDDVPDGDPEVLLKGFGLEDAHATVNSMTWGPDGWLYGAQGSTVTARIRGIEFQQGIWRYEPRSRRFELFAEGGGNTWGLDFDRAGHAFGSSNGGFIAFHMVQGGYYWKGFAKHGPLHNPRAYGYFDCIAYEGPKRGGHVTPGGIIYKGGQFPAEFDGVFLGGNLLSNAVYWHPLSRLGSSFKGRHGGSLIEARDTWFRPIDLLTGPDGAVYLVDWYDRRASHLDPRDNWDRSNGRIYRISYGECPGTGPIDLGSMTGQQLLSFRTHANDWWPDTARRILFERRDESLVPELLGLLRANQGDPIVAMRDLWALDACVGLDDSVAEELLGHRLGEVRRWVIRRLGDDGRMNRSIQSRLIELARTESDPDARSQLASSCQRWTPGEAFPILRQMVLREEDASDPHIPLLLWWAIEKQMRLDVAGAVDLLTSQEARGSKLVVEHLMERMARALAEGGRTADAEQAARMLAAATDPEILSRVVRGLDKGMEGRRLDAVPEALAAPLGKLLAEKPVSVGVIRVAARMGSPEAVDACLKALAEPSTGLDDRKGLLELLGSIREEKARQALLGLARAGVAAELQEALVMALGNYPNEDGLEVLLSRWPSLGGVARSRLVELMCSRPSWARVLVDRLERGTGPIEPRELRPAQVAQMARLGDEGLSARLAAVWGPIPQPSSPEKAKRIAEVRGMLPEGDKGDAGRGVAVFRQTCAGCHKLFGEGEAIGPDLTGADRSLDFLLESVVNPSVVMRKEYLPVTVALADGRVLTGLVVEESEAALTLFDSQKRRTVVPKDQVEEMKASETSVMPEGLLDPLSETQIRDLFRYLQSSGPPG